jgi:hypothetical protein
MSRFNTLLYGKPDDALDVLDGTELEKCELQAALTNAFRRIRELEKIVAHIQSAPISGQFTVKKETGDAEEDDRGDQG